MSFSDIFTTFFPSKISIVTFVGSSMHTVITLILLFLSSGIPNRSKSVFETGVEMGGTKVVADEVCGQLAMVRIERIFYQSDVTFQSRLLQRRLDMLDV